ncbi:DUF6542 domain-containing protein [Streptomyces hiroshimensis]|uniref:DUF6542 domain-containing protein n=1 Tax=Streptomyces hiroshimensis TaxID=66424 RepID=A0ABQ2YXM4_9ACTN|nr:DUF6542 domain-containing protein [Streptomyces hiroshimensis]GGX98624.1 hypothetical protein GCM10010324_51310 [Streptomyces hiroshimensis]
MGRRRSETPGKRTRRAGTALLAPGALLLAGAAVDEAAGAGLGWVFALSAAAATALAAVLCARAHAWWVLAAPPLVIAAVAVGAQLVAAPPGTGAGGGGDTLAAAAHWALDTFPAMVAAEAVAALVLAVRTFRPGRGRRACHA